MIDFSSSLQSMERLEMCWLASASWVEIVVVTGAGLPQYYGVESWGGLGGSLGE